MEAKELTKFIDENAPVREKLRRITELDKVIVKDIEKIETHSYQIQAGEETKTVNRFILTIKGERVECPRSVMTQLNAVLKKYSDKITAFSVVKSGQGINTTYAVVPEVAII
jgi:hypothetical protein